MENGMLVALLCILTFGHSAQNAVELLEFVVSPKEILSPLTKMMTVNCSFKAETTSNISNLLTLSVSKSDLQDDHPHSTVELVSVNIFFPNRVSALSEVYNASISGHIESRGDSYLSLQWSYPSGVEAGLYQCEARGIDDTGHVLTLSETAKVTSRLPNREELLYTVSDLQMELEQVKKTYTKTVSELQTVVSDLQLQFQKMPRQIASLRSANDFEVSEMYNGHIYLLSKKVGKSAIDAEATCEQHSGYLAEIDDASEYAFIKDFIDPFSNVSAVMLGGTDEAQDGTWVFRYSGRPVVFTAWHTNEPNFLNWDCVAIIRENQWKMNAVACSNIYSDLGYLCEVPAF